MQLLVSVRPEVWITSVTVRGKFRAVAVSPVVVLLGAKLALGWPALAGGLRQLRTPDPGRLTLAVVARADRDARVRADAASPAALGRRARPGSSTTCGSPTPRTRSTKVCRAGQP